MILSDKDIKAYLASGRLVIDPISNPDQQIQPASVDLTLSNEFRVFEHTEKAFIDPLKDGGLEEYTRLKRVDDKGPFIIHPGQFVLGSTREYVKIPYDLVGRLEGRSSLGRLGIVVHSTAGYVDPGFYGTLTLEIGNMGNMPVALYPGMRVCQITLIKMSSEPDRPYDKKPDAKYLGQKSPEASRITRDKEFRK